MALQMFSSKTVLMAQVDPDDDEIERFVVRRYAYDPAGASGATLLRLRSTIRWSSRPRLTLRPPTCDGVESQARTSTLGSTSVAPCWSR